MRSRARIDDSGAIVGTATYTPPTLPPGQSPPAGQPAAGSHGVMLLPVTVTSVTFTNDPSATPPNNFQVESDAVDPTSGSHTQFSAPQWADTNNQAGTTGWDSTSSNPNEHDNAVAYAMNTKPCIGATFKIPGASNWTNLKFKATGPDGISIPATAGTVGADGMTVTMPTTASTTALPNTIKYYNKADSTSFTLNWSLSIDGGTTWSMINSTKHTVYVVLAAPTYAAANEETPFYIGCSSAAGKSTQNDMISAVWAKFQTLNVNMVASTSAMTYYANSAAPYTTPNGPSGLLNSTPPPVHLPGMVVAGRFKF